MSQLFKAMLKVGRGFAGTPLVSGPARVVPRPRALATKADGSAPIKSVTKKDLVNVVAEKAGISSKQAESALNGLLDAIVNTVAKGEKVEIKGFGSFQPRRSAARNGRNPATGEPLYIPESVTASFTAGKNFKETVKNAHKQ